MMKGWIEDVRVTVDHSNHGMESEVVPADWSPWSRTFLFMPKQDIHGNYIIGPAYMRIMRNVRHQATDSNIVWVYHKDIVEFCRSKKDIFMRELNGTAKD